MGDIANGIINLSFVQRAARPIGKTCALINANTQPLIDQIGIANLLCLPQSHGGNLRVKQRKRGLSRKIIDDFQILTTGMKYL